MHHLKDYFMPNNRHLQQSQTTHLDETNVKEYLKDMYIV